MKRVDAVYRSPWIDDELRTGQRFRSKPAAVFWFVCLVLSAGANVRATAVIALDFPDRPTPDDLLFRLVSFWEPASWLADFNVLLSVMVFAVWAIRNKPFPLERAFFALTCMYTLRGILVMLTPLANPLPPEIAMTLLPVNHGMFPSGHMALATLLALLSTQPRIRLLLGSLAAIEAALLILGRGHYSIDIVGGFFVAYFVVSEAPRLAYRISASLRALIPLVSLPAPALVGLLSKKRPKERPDGEE